ncbi:MAG: HAD family hydrolase [Candidatus Hodarchaeota archaeon]
MHISAILLDLHNTITKHLYSPLKLLVEITGEFGVDLSSFKDTELNEAFEKSDRWFKQEQLNNNVGPHWGQEPRHWLNANRIMFESLGVTDLDNDVILMIENQWHEKVSSSEFEILADDILETLKELRKRNYLLGICTRRTISPDSLLKSHRIDKYFESVQWSGVIGYAKPSPYTLIMAAKELGVNPRKCAMVGNYVNADVEAAKRAGMLPVLLTWANPDEAEKAEKGTIVLESPKELLQLFKGPDIEIPN